MNNTELADEIERWLADDPDHMGLHSLSEAQWRGIVAAMRRQPEGVVTGDIESIDSALTFEDDHSADRWRCCGHKIRNGHMLDCPWARIRAMLAAAEASKEDK